MRKEMIYYVCGVLLISGVQLIHAESMFEKFFPEEGYEVAYLVEPAFGRPEGFSIMKDGENYIMTVKSISNWEKVNKEADRLSKETVVGIKSPQSLTPEEHQRISENNKQAFKNIRKMILSRIRITEKKVVIGEETAKKMLETFKSEAEASTQDTNRLDGSVQTVSYRKDGKYYKKSF